MDYSINKQNHFSIDEFISSLAMEHLTCFDCNFMPKNLNENIIIHPSKYQYRHCQVLSIIKKKISLNNFLNMIAHMFQHMKIKKLVSLGMMDREADAI